MKKFQTQNKDEAKVIFACPSLNVLYKHDQLVYKGPREVIIECKTDPILFGKLLKINSQNNDTYFPNISKIIAWLEKEEIKYFIDEEIKKQKGI